MLLVAAVYLYSFMFFRSLGCVDGGRAETTKAEGGNTDVVLSKNQLSLNRIPCTVNGKPKGFCLRDAENEIYLPFNRFVKKYFEVSGSVKQNADGVEEFQFLHSYAKLQRPDFDVYDPFGPYGQFRTYNVAERDRVFCISARYGVPLSVQWKAQPYYYPIQVAQFALEHYSKNKTDFTPLRLPLAAAVSQPSRYVRKTVNATWPNGLWYFKSFSQQQPGLQFYLNSSSDTSELFILRFTVMFTATESSFTVRLRKTDTQTEYFMHYVLSDDELTTKRPNQIFYGLGSTSAYRTWRRITRNLLIDLYHGLALFSKHKKPSRKLLHTRNSVALISLTFQGEGFVATPFKHSSCHMDHFFDGADWLLAAQNSKGGWPIGVRRVIANGALVLKPGWYSAMAQGQAMSVLCRAYNVSGNSKYLKAAAKAADLFLVNASEGGLVNYLFGHIPWYEEYPTVPGTFVLNGFLNSLLGLYDLSRCEATGRSLELFRRGLDSLEVVLPLYDTGYGSSYDMRHVSLRHVPPNIARWDYHSLHIYQLLWLHVIDSSRRFNETAERWIRYSLGERAKHN